VRKVTMTVTAAALLLGTVALQASAQNQQRGAASIHALRNATPIVTPAACYGGTGYCGCGPGWISAYSPPLLPMRTLLVRGGSAIVPECFEAASARRPRSFDLSVSCRLPATGKAVSAAGWELPRRGARALGGGACITSFRPNRVEAADD